MMPRAKNPARPFHVRVHDPSTRGQAAAFCRCLNDFYEQNEAAILAIQQPLLEACLFHGAGSLQAQALEGPVQRLIQVLFDEWGTG